jgi:glucose-6-phosphate isomerase
LTIDLEETSGLPVKVDSETCEIVLGSPLNTPSFLTRKLHDLDAVWANEVLEEDRLIYRYTSALWLPGDEELWRQAGAGYGIVIFLPGVFGGEYVKSSGQYHAIASGQRMATPEIYTVLAGCGHFMLQRSAPPYEEILDAVLVEVNAGETFVVPPDYGHLQINPGDGPLIFSYTVASPLVSNYEPYRQRRGGIYYEMAVGPERFMFNCQYPRRVPLRILQAAHLGQIPSLAGAVDYHRIRACLPQLVFLTRPEEFPVDAYL